MEEATLTDPQYESEHSQAELAFRSAYGEWLDNAKNDPIKGITLLGCRCEEFTVAELDAYARLLSRSPLPPFSAASLLKAHTEELIIDTERYKWRLDLEGLSEYTSIELPADQEWQSVKLHTRQYTHRHLMKGFWRQVDSPPQSASEAGSPVESPPVRAKRRREPASDYEPVPEVTSEEQVTPIKATASEAQDDPIAADDGVALRLINARKQLLGDYKSVVQPKPSNKMIYTAGNSGIHKPQFYEWLQGKLSSESKTALNFERFLRAKKAPLPRHIKA